MTACHVGHDCIVGSETVMANCSLLGGHSEVGDFVVLGGHCAIHQFVRVGRYAMVSGMTGVADDVIPFGNAYPYDNPRAFLAGLNLIGMKRRGFTNEQIQTLRKAYDRLFAPGATVAARAEAVAQEFPDDPGVAEIVEFVRKAKARKVCMPYAGRGSPG
jgi:UDP-N-acetylglucosamine acyltransferase